jgi:hypothetical protein
LENSTHALESDPAFQPADGFHVRHFPPSAHPERGKGFQEFEMLDAKTTQVNIVFNQDWYCKISGERFAKL